MKNNKKRIEIIDTTLRDGAQSPVLAYQRKYSYTTAEKLAIFTALHKYGVRFVEVFSPIVSQQEKKDLDVLIKRRNQLEKETGQRTNILAHVRCNTRDVSEAVAAGVDGLNLYMGTSTISRIANHGKDLGQIVKKARTLLKEIRRSYPQLQLRFSGEDAFRTTISDLVTVYDELYEYVDRFGTPDTVGNATPAEVEKRVRFLKNRYPRAALEGHFHNDRRFSTINGLTAIKAGMQYINTSILGLAERSGITSMTALILNIFLEQPSFVDDYSLKASYAINIMLADMLHMQVPWDEPVSLTNRTHIAGVHGGAMLRNSGTYEALPLETFGVQGREILLNPLTGKHVIHYYLTQILEYQTTTLEVAEKITNEFKNTMIKSKKQDPRNILEQLAEEHQLTKLQVPQTHVENLE